MASLEGGAMVVGLDDLDFGLWMPGGPVGSNGMLLVLG